jgi:hypothetical protein
MSLKAEIGRAISAHAEWKARLEGAIASGRCDVKPAEVRRDDLCELGQWLHGSAISEHDKASPYYESVKLLHADFHRGTAEILLFALVGKAEMARQLMGTGSHHASLSAELTRTLTRWRDGSH